MWMAMLCSVTVSMGEETKGVLRVMRFVTGESRVTSEAGKPSRGIVRSRSKFEGGGKRLGKREKQKARRRTNVSREHEEVVVRQTAILGGIDQSLDVDAVMLAVLVLQHLESLGEVKGASGIVGHVVTVGDSHVEGEEGDEKEKIEVRLNKETDRRLRRKAIYGRAKVRTFPKRKKSSQCATETFLCGEEGDRALST